MKTFACLVALYEKRVGKNAVYCPGNTTIKHTRGGNSQEAWDEG